MLDCEIEIYIVCLTIHRCNLEYFFQVINFKFGVYSSSMPTWHILLS